VSPSTGFSFIASVFSSDIIVCSFSATVLKSYMLRAGRKPAVQDHANHGPGTPID
jgi:hypothetical protein